LEQVRAERFLHDPASGTLTPEQYYEVALLAGWSQEEAGKALSQRMWEKMKAADG
jgi:hypothetical protein